MICFFFGCDQMFGMPMKCNGSVKYWLTIVEGCSPLFLWLVNISKLNMLFVPYHARTWRYFFPTIMIIVILHLSWALFSLLISHEYTSYYGTGFWESRGVPSLGRSTVEVDAKLKLVTAHLSCFVGNTMHGLQFLRLTFPFPSFCSALVFGFIRQIWSIHEGWNLKSS